MRNFHLMPVLPYNLDPPIARSLTIQFILQTFIACFDTLHHLRTFTDQQLKGIEPKKEIGAVAKSLEKMMILSMGAPIIPKTSCLDKLCFYCEVLIQASQITQNDIVVIVEQMKTQIIDLKTKIILWKKIAIESIEIIRQEFFQLYKLLEQKLSLFFRSFVPFLKEARSDENILIYLIERKEEFNACLGSRTIEELLQLLFPSGHAQLRAAVIEGFMRRGFTVFLSQIEPLIDAIEWEAPYCCTN